MTDKYTIAEDAPITGLDKLRTSVRTFVAKDKERREAEFAVKTQTFDELLPIARQLVTDIRTFGVANGATDTTPVSEILSAARQRDAVIADALPANGSGSASRLNTLALYDSDEHEADYRASCTEHKDGDKTWPAIAPTVAGYCSWLNVLMGKARASENGADKPYLDKITNRVVRPRAPKPESPKPDAVPDLDIDAAMAKLAELAPSLPKAFVPAEYTVKDWSRIAEFATLAAAALAHKDVSKRTFLAQVGVPGSTRRS